MDPFEQAAAAQAAAPASTPNADPFAVAAQRMQPAPQPQASLGPQTGNAIGNALTSAFHGMEGLGNAGIRVANKLGMVSDERAQQAIGNQLFHPDESRLSHTVGEGLGQVAQQYAFGPAAPGAFAIEGAEAAKENIEAQQAMHPEREISDAGQVADVFGQAGLQAGVSALGPGQRVMGGLLKRMPTVGNAVTNAAARTGMGAAIGGGENLGINDLSNAITKYSGVNPDQEIGEGSGKAFGVGAVFGGVGQALHETPGLVGRLKARRAADAEALQAKSNDPFAIAAKRQGSAPAEAQPAQPVEGVNGGKDQQLAKEETGPALPHTPDDRQAAPEAEAAKKSVFTKKAQDVATDEGRPAPAEAGAAVQEARPGEVQPHETFDQPGVEAVRPGTEGSEKPAEGAQHPAELADAQAVSKWYADTFKDTNPDNVGGIEAMASMGKGKYKLADVPTGSLDPLAFASGDKDPAKVESIKNLSPEDKAKLPPVIAVPAGKGKLAVADGSHRTMGMQAAGEKTMRAYVPEEYVGKNGITEAGKPVEAPAPQQPGKRSALAKNAGVVAIPDSLNKLFENDVRPAVEEARGNARKSWDAVNRFAGTGANWSEAQRDTATSLRTMLGQHETNQARAETQIKPYRDLLEKMPEQERTHWVDQVEATGTAPDKATQPLAEWNRQMNEKNIAEGAKYGLKVAGWDQDWVGRMAEFPTDKGNGTKSSVAGGEKFLKKRVYNTFSEFKQAVEDAGGKLKYTNPADMELAKQMEVRRSIDSRKQMYQSEDRGQLKWVPDGERPPETHDTELKDKLGKQERDVVAPKWMVGKLSGLTHFEAQKYMESPEWKGKTQVLRPGDTMPEGMSKTGETVKGKFMGDANTAGIFNNLISAGLMKDTPILKQVAQVRRAMTAANLALPTVHASLETIGSGVTSIANAMDNVFHGEWGLAGKNVWRALNPIAANKFGRSVREQLADPTAHPELEQVAQTVQRGGNHADLTSVLDKSTFKEAQEQWKAGNPVGAGTRLAKFLYGKISSPLFDHYIPNLKQAYKAAAAETAIARGMSGKELDRHMSLVQDNADNILGMVKRDYQFQNKILTDIEDLAFTAPKFTEGTARFAGATLRDTAQALKDVVSGKSPTVTPAMYTAFAGLMAHSIGAAAFQAVYSMATTGKMQKPDKLADYIRPRTGRKDENGNEQRVSILSPFSFLFSAAHDAEKSVMSRTGSLWRGLGNVARNADERNTQIHNPNDNFFKQRLDDAKYMGKEAEPYALQNVLQNKHSGHKTTADQTVGETLGFHYAYSPAGDAEKAALDTIYGHGRANPRTQQEAAKSDLIRDLSGRVKDKDPQAWQEARKAVREGKLAGADLKTIETRAAEKPGLQGLLKQSSLSGRDIMDQVWPKMTPEERRANQWVVRGRVGRQEKLPVADRQRYFKQISDDVKAGQ